MKVLYFGQQAWEEAYIRNALNRDDITFVLGTAQDTTISDSDAEVLSVFVDSIVGKEELNRYPNLKLIATRSTGYDHIDLEEVKKRGIAVTSVPSYGVNTVAEFAFAMLLELARKVSLAKKHVQTSNSFTQTGLTGFDLAGKTIGIVGCGHIGVHAIKIAKGFEMHVLVFDMHQDNALAEALGFTYVSFDDLLAQSDIISLHVPYNEHTHHLINKQNISHIKKGAYLLNTARGAVAENAALVEALQQNILAGAGLDVIDGEPDVTAVLTSPEGQYLLNHPQVIITPHVAFDTNEAIQRILDTTAQNIVSFEQGAPTNIL